MARNQKLLTRQRASKCKSQNLMKKIVFANSKVLIINIKFIFTESETLTIFHAIYSSPFKEPLLFLLLFEKQVQNYGTRKDKLKIICDRTLDEFKNAMQKKLPVHDNDIRRWPISKARTLGYNSFTAWKFKSTN